MQSTFYPISDTMRRIMAYAAAPDKVRIIGPACYECVYERALLPRGIQSIRQTLVNDTDQA